VRVAARRQRCTALHAVFSNLVRRDTVGLGMDGARAQEVDRAATLKVIQDYLRASADNTVAAAAACAEPIAAAAAMLAASVARGGKILLCGNGGSAADCQHVATEFVSRLTRDSIRPAIPAIALTTDTSFLTAFANDVNFEDIFARQIEALGRSGDVLVGISTSGRSTNVVKAAERARAQGLSIVALVGGDGGPLRTLADVAICVPGASTQHVQEGHLVIEHVICHIVEDTLYPRASRPSR
jgi:D-sedoheptulose 7-phosphate isomerase